MSGALLERGTEFGPGVKDKLRGQIAQVIERAQGKRNLGNLFGLRHNQAVLFHWFPITEELTLRQLSGLAGGEVPDDKPLCETLVKEVVGEFADINTTILVGSEQTPLERAAIWNSNQGIIFRREEFAPQTFDNASTNHRFGLETRYVVAVAKRISKTRELDSNTFRG